MVYMFFGVLIFNKNIFSWNVDNVLIMEKMFENVLKFNSLIFNLVSLKVKNM